MLTLYYVSATFLQSWRIKNVCTKIAEQLAQQSSIAFYTLPAAAGDNGYNAVIATSELCSNRSSAKITELLWLCGPQRGCCMQPVQSLHVVPWLSFPEATTSLIPFAYNEPLENIYRSPLHKRKLLYLLLETETKPNYDNDYDANIVRIEEYGKLIAWKIDSNLSVIIETDVENFTKLLISTFLQNNLLINDQLPLLRIESIKPEGKPQPFHMVSSHLRKATRQKSDRLTNEEWEKHLEDLRLLSVLASQAAEYEYNKNRTEGKTGKVKPDLIPAEKKLSNETEQLNQIKIEETKQNKEEVEKEIEKKENLVEKEIKLDSPKSTDIKIEALKAEPTENNLPVKNETRFTTTKVPESPNRSQFTLAKAIIPTTVIERNSKKSELEKLAAHTVAKRERTPSPKAKQELIPSQKATTTPPPKTTTPPPKATTSSPKAKATPVQSPIKTDVAEITEAITKTLPAITTSSPKAMATSVKTPIITEVAEIAEAITKTLPEISEINTNCEITSKVTNNLVAMASKSDESQKILDENETATSDTVIAASNEANKISVNKDHTKRPSLRRNKDSLGECKPLNILVYSNSATTRESALLTLQNILEKDTYTLYPLIQQQVEEKHWLENTALLVVCGTITANIGEIFVDYFLRGGKVMSLCSEFLHFILPTYRTAEVRENELVQFSYAKWQKVRMMHHIFCYQPSPVKKNFSTESEDSTNAIVRKPALVCPRSIELKDVNGEQHNLNVQVLGTEETWNTPSLLLAKNIKSDGRVIFSQVHLETSPMQFEMDETKFPVLKQNDNIRLEILADLLAKYLNVSVRKTIAPEGDVKFQTYPNAYFLGRYESKFELLQKLKAEDGSTVINTTNLTLKFFTDDDKPINIVNKNVLPIHIHSCPDDFSTVEYFDNLKTNNIGRLVIYAPLLNSSMYVINDTDLFHGITVLPRQQTAAVGRSNNQWLSPLGCAMFSIQLHFSKDSSLCSRLPLLQHIVGAAIVNSLRNHELYNVLDIALKWPNDIYANGIIKIGGLVVKTSFNGEKIIVNIGSGINLDNTKPTLCINDMIKRYNNTNHKTLPCLSYEKFIALIFNEIERLIDEVQNDKFDDFYKLYYDLWLHTEQTINICDKDGTSQEAQIIGIDDCGYLQVKLSTNKIETVQPDGNSFDMLRGLIVPKYH